MKQLIISIIILFSLKASSQTYFTLQNVSSNTVHKVKVTNVYFCPIMVLISPERIDQEDGTILGAGESIEIEMSSDIVFAKVLYVYYFSYVQVLNDEWSSCLLPLNIRLVKVYNVPVIGGGLKFKIGGI